MANYFDINGDGRITAEDFQMAALMRGHSSLGSQVKAKAAFKMLDTNGNGMLDGNEAFGLFRNMPGNYAGYGAGNPYFIQQQTPYMNTYYPQVFPQLQQVMYPGYPTYRPY